MKRFIQIVALAVGFLLVAQPALANVSCSHQICGSDHSASNCCKHAGGMPMPGMSSDEAIYTIDSTSAGRQTMWRAALTELGCAAGTACMASVSPMPRITAIPTTNMSVVGLISMSQAGEAVPIFAVRSADGVAAPVSAKYILFQTFRI